MSRENRERALKAAYLFVLVALLALLVYSVGRGQ
ncbi:hypothetical protein GA0115237_1119101 [Streptomyces sp. ScaeMP-6W]|nr:hypothetical protein GA0115237_1119101 [Streptomyces sp. ScaeMP-6W]